MGAPTKRARKIRSAAEFDIAKLMASLSVPTDGGILLTSWTLDQIFKARDDQQRGRFEYPAKMAERMRTDDAFAVARRNRLAPQRCTQIELVPAKGARGAGIAKEAEALYGQNGVAVSPGTRADVHGCLVDHGLAFAYNSPTLRDDKTRLDLEVKYWPIEHVEWDPLYRTFRTRVDPSSIQPGDVSFGSRVPISHGDGRWIIFSNHDHEPFKQDAAILDGSVVWARHAHALRDWAKSSVAHGCAKVIGEMPSGVPLQKDGLPSPEAAAMIELMRAIISSDSPVGLRPFGSKTDFITNTSSAWQVFDKLVENAERAFARILLGTDGTLGSTGGAPGVDVQALFGVATTRVQGDLGAISRGLQTGSIEVWAALNFGDSTLAPLHRYMLPDADADAARASVGTRRQAFYADIEAARKNGFGITQEFVDNLAEAYDIEAPTLLVKPVTPAETAPAALRSVSR